MALPLIAVLAILALWSVYWLVAFTLAQSGFASERQRLSARGVTLTCANESWGGFPFRFEYECEGLGLADPQGNSARSARVLAVAQAYAPWTVILFADGPSSVTLQGQPEATVQHDRIIASLNLRSPQQPIATAELRHVAIDQIATVDSALISYRRTSRTSEDLAIEATHLAITLVGQPSLVFDSLSADVNLEKRSAITLHRSVAVLGKVTASASGTGSLDAKRRPQGQLDITLSNPAEAARMAALFLGLSPDNQSAIAAALTLVGGKATLVAKDGVLSLGHFPLATLPPLK
jgi:hypothetical protein